MAGNYTVLYLLNTPEALHFTKSGQWVGGGGGGFGRGGGLGGEVIRT